MKRDEDDALARLQELEAEVQTEHRAKQAARRAAEEAERERREQAALALKRSREETSSPGRNLPARTSGSNLPARGDERAETGLVERLRRKVDPDTAVAIARDARKELEKGPDAGKKSIVLSAGLSLLFGPLGWMYAGAWREAIPASAAYLLVGAMLAKLPFLAMPVLMVALPISAIAGLVYGWQYNRSGHRQRMFGKEPDEE